MRVRREAAGRCVPNHGGRSGHLITDAIEHAPVDARDRGGNPRKLGCMHRDPLREIGVQFHQSFVRNDRINAKNDVDDRLAGYLLRTASAMRATISFSIAGGVAKFSRANPA